MRIRVLGCCAGGGLPQWNCGCPNCVRARAGDPKVPPRTQPSLAVSADGARWSVLNASPDIRWQFAAFPGLHPRPGTRDLPLDTVVVTNADLDHVLGLLVLREALSYRILSTRWVRDAVVEHNAAFGLVAPVWTGAGLDEEVDLDATGALGARFFPVPGKVPTWLGERVAYRPEATCGLRITERRTGRRLVYVPGIRELDAGTLAEIREADCAFVDGTFFTAEELRAYRPGAPDAFAMGHVPVTGPGGSLEALAGIGTRCLYIHMNNTNPVLEEGSDAERRVLEAGLEIARDGVEVAL